MERSLTPRGPFTLASTARFIGGWEAANRTAGDDAVVRLGFLVEDGSGVAGVAFRQDADGIVHGTIDGDGDLERAWAQALHVVSLDHDAAGYAALGERDPVVGRLQRESGFLRPVLFHSPYEAACWGIVSARLHHRRASAVRASLSEALGGAVVVAGERMLTFPPPARLLEITEWPSLAAEKIRRLHGVAEAALRGELDRASLERRGEEEVKTALGALRGIGPFWTDLIWLRAVGPTDALSTVEPKARAKVARLYATPAAEHDAGAFARIAEAWRPFRTWVTVLVRAAG